MEAHRRCASYSRKPVPSSHLPHPTGLLKSLISSEGEPTKRKTCISFAGAKSLCPGKQNESDAAAAIKLRIEPDPRKICADEHFQKDLELAVDSSDDGFMSDDEDGMFSTPSASSFTTASLGGFKSRFDDEEREEKIEIEADMKGLEKDTFALDEEDVSRDEYCRRLEDLKPASPSDIDPSFPSAPFSLKPALLSQEHDAPNVPAREGDALHTEHESLPSRRRLCCPAIRIMAKRALDQPLDQSV